MINDGQSTLLLYCCEDVKSHRSGGDTMPLIAYRVFACDVMAAMFVYLDKRILNIFF